MKKPLTAHFTCFAYTFLSASDIPQEWLSIRRIIRAFICEISLLKCPHALLPSPAHTESSADGAVNVYRWTILIFSIFVWWRQPRMSAIQKIIRNLWFTDRSLKYFQYTNQRNSTAQHPRVERGSAAPQAGCWGQPLILERAHLVGTVQEQENHFWLATDTLTWKPLRGFYLEPFSRGTKSPSG